MAAPVLIAKPTYTPIPTPTVIPTPTDVPFVRQSGVEVVTNNAVTGDGGNSWGGHQTRIVHTQDGIFTAYTVAGTDYLNRKWNLVERQADGSWLVLAHGRAGREPVNLLAFPDGTLVVIGWPAGVGTLWSGRPVDGKLAMTSVTIPNMVAGYWPYSSAGIDSSGNLCVLSSSGGSGPGGRFNWACYLQATRSWITRTNKLDYRYAYTYVFPGPGRQLSLVSTRDVLWQGLGYQQPPGTADYAFNALGLWQTGDYSKTPAVRTALLEEKPTPQFPLALLDANEDVYVDTMGRIHVLYHAQGESTGGALTSRHAVFSPEGKLLYDIPVPGAAGGFSRIFQDREGMFYLLGSSGYIYPMGADGIHASTPLKLDLGGYSVEYSGFGLSVPRTGTPLGNVMDVVFPSGGGTQWIYFQLDFSGH